MANREELVVIRAARAGQAAAQLALGKRYLFGGAGLPKSETTALYWLDRAAHQQQVEAWLLIGSHIPFEAATKSDQPALMCVWYERAFARLGPTSRHRSCGESKVGAKSRARNGSRRYRRRKICRKNSTGLQTIGTAFLNKFF